MLSAKSPDPMEVEHALLLQGLERLNITVKQQQIEQWLKHVVLLEKWNSVTNLTAVRERQEMVTRHTLDSLSIGCLPPGDLLDVGSGGGMPGIPLAILEPQRAITLLDSNIKKTRFLHQVVTELELTNVGVIHSRIEDWEPAQLFDIIISRAFTAVPRFSALSQRLMTASGQILAMIGKLETADLSAIPNEFVYTVKNLNVPGLEADRHLVTIKQS